MLNRKRAALLSNSSGQSLVETVLVTPLLVLLVLNAVNFGYFFLITLNLTAATRSSGLYVIEGGASPTGGIIPSSGGSSPTTSKDSVTYLIYQDLTGAVWNPTGVSVQVCSQANLDSNLQGVNTTNGALRTNCELCTSSGCGAAAANATGFPVPSADPEAPTFVLNRVDIKYDFSTLIPGNIFNIPLQASGMCNSGSCTFYRHAEMRAMN
jgi:hypothetical protein